MYPYHDLIQIHVFTQTKDILNQATKSSTKYTDAFYIFLLSLSNLFPEQRTYSGFA